MTHQRPWTRPKQAHPNHRVASTRCTIDAIGANEFRQRIRAVRTAAATAAPASRFLRHRARAAQTAAATGTMKSRHCSDSNCFHSCMKFAHSTGWPPRPAPHPLHSLTGSGWSFLAPCTLSHRPPAGVLTRQFLHGYWRAAIAAPTTHGANRWRCQPETCTINGPSPTRPFFCAIQPSTAPNTYIHTTHLQTFNVYPAI